MESELRHHLLACMAAFAVATRLSPATIGRRVANDGRFFDRLKADAGFTVGKYDEVMGWFSANWPSAALWPDGVPRPVADEAAA